MFEGHRISVLGTAVGNDFHKKKKTLARVFLVVRPGFSVSSSIARSALRDFFFFFALTSIITYGHASERIVRYTMRSYILSNPMVTESMLTLHAWCSYYNRLSVHYQSIRVNLLTGKIINILYVLSLMRYSDILGVEK